MRYRYINIGIWSDGKFRFLSNDAKLVYFHAISANNSASMGLFSASIQGMAADMDLSEKRYKMAIRQLISKFYLEVDKVAQVFYLPGTATNFPPLSINAVKAWGRIYREEIPPTPLKKKLLAELDAIMEGKSVGIKEAYAEAFDLDKG
ncbi:hypothetical protein KAR91_77200 [Candidatus Pacearchaeota archaeon]|nr:hypothetical protein [Candidatus Pacearchaeota archaeon]